MGDALVRKALSMSDQVQQCMLRGGHAQGSSSSAQHEPFREQRHGDPRRFGPESALWGWLDGELRRLKRGQEVTKDHTIILAILAIKTTVNR